MVPSPPHHGTILLNRSILNTITPNCIQYKRVLISAFFKYDGVKNTNTNTKVLSTQLSYILNAFFRDTPPAYCFFYVTCHLSLGHLGTPGHLKCKIISKWGIPSQVPQPTCFFRGSPAWLPKVRRGPCLGIPEYSSASLTLHPQRNGLKIRCFELRVIRSFCRRGTQCFRMKTFLNTPPDVLYLKIWSHL